VKAPRQASSRLHPANAANPRSQRRAVTARVAPPSGSSDTAFATERPGTGSLIPETLRAGAHTRSLQSST
jgi:hypothetical protein